MSTTYIKGFDALRALSIILVIASHLGLYDVLPESDFVRTRLWMVINGTTGVQVFFTLSGFLITSILIKELSKTGTIHFRNFYARRFLRLLPPLVIFYIFIGILMNQNMIESSRIGLSYSIFYIYNFVPRIHNISELGHMWSLALEEQFYLAWPLVLFFIRNLRSAIFVIIGAIGLCVLSVFIYQNIEWTKYYNSERWFFPAIAPVLIGSAFAMVQQLQSEKWKGFIQKDLPVFFISMLCFFSPLYFPLKILNLAFIPQAVGIAIFLMWILNHQRSRLVHFLNNPVLNYIGKISYGLYVYQGIFLRTGPGGELFIQQAPLNLGLTILVAILSFHLIENPVLKFKSRFQ
jgi:peptidoglycan/LPS O-acetylase OafA/YrhL